MIQVATVTDGRSQRACRLWRNPEYVLPPLLLPNSIYLAATRLDTCKVSTLHNHIQAKTMSMLPWHRIAKATKVQIWGLLTLKCFTEALSTKALQHKEFVCHGSPICNVEVVLCSSQLGL